MWWTILLVQIGFFLLLVFFLQRLFQGNLLAAISRVQNLQQQNLKKEKELKLYEEKIKAECEAKIREMNEEVTRQREIAEKEIKAYKNSMAVEVEEEKKVVLKGVLEKEKLLEKRFEDEVKSQGTLIAMKILEGAFSPQMREGIHRELVQELLASLPKMDAVKQAKPESVKIKTALPFSASERSQLKKILSLSSDVEIKETEDASLVAGFVLFLGKTELDGSLKSRFDKVSRGA